jgi:hypothetical protein
MDERVRDSRKQLTVRSLVDANDCVARADATPSKYFRRYPTKTARRVISAHAKRFLKARARMTFSRHLEHRVPYAKLPVFQRQQIDAARHQIATEDLWRERFKSKMTGDGCETLGLDERNLPFSRIATVVIAFQAVVRIQDRFINRAHRRTALGPRPDPNEHTGSDGRIEEAGQRRLWVERHK